MTAMLISCHANDSLLLCVLLSTLQVNADAAAKAVDTCLATWVGATPQPQTAALADV
jgi:hypothetical protein